MDERNSDGAPLEFLTGIELDVSRFAIENGYAVRSGKPIHAIEPIGWLVPIASEYKTHIGVVYRGRKQFTIVDPLWIFLERIAMVRRIENEQFDLCDQPVLVQGTMGF